MLKKILKFISGLLYFSILVGCSKEKIIDIDIADDLNSKAKCDVYECIRLIETKNSVEQINNIIGFEGELIDESSNEYYWEFSENIGIRMRYSSSNSGIVSLDYITEDLANKNVDFSRYDELKIKIKEGISYDEFISYIGGVDGVMIEKSSVTTKYIWVSSTGDYLRGSFSNNSRHCTFIYGRIS